MNLPAEKRVRGKTLVHERVANGSRVGSNREKKREKKGGVD